MKQRYQLLKIDVTDTYPLADVFDEEKYIGYLESNNIEQLLDYVIKKFPEENPKIKIYSEWEEFAEEGATEYELIHPHGTILRGSLMLIPQFMGAFFLIRQYHGGQTRKGDGFPYLEHPLEVGYMLWRNKFPVDVVTAGFCYDLLEDTKCTEEEIVKYCGEDVLKIVKSVSNDESLSDKKDWEKKKEKYVDNVAKGGEKAIAVSVVDKICNLQSFFDQYELEGSALWKKFNRGKEKKVWFEKLVLEMAKKNWKHPLIDRLEQMIKKLEKTEE